MKTKEVLQKWYICPICDNYYDQYKSAQICLDNHIIKENIEIESIEYNNNCRFPSDIKIKDKKSKAVCFYRRV